MSWFSEFIGGLEDAVKDPVTLVIATAYAFTGNYVMAATTIAASATGYALAARNTQEASYTDFVSENENRTQMIKQPTAPRRFIYGETRVSGVLGYVQSTNKNARLHLVIMVANHEIESFQTFYINNQAVTLDGNGNVTSPAKFNGKVRILSRTGTDTQSAIPQLINESGGKWTSNHKLSGIAYIYVRLIYKQKLFPSGIPNISAKVRGKKLYDPRTSTTAYSANPALAIRDYLTNSAYGFNASTDEIDDTAFITAANICDESVTLNGGGTQNRYEINGTFVTSNAPKRILEDMMTSCGGLVSYSNGKFKLKAAKYITPTITLTEDDVIGSLQMQTKQSKRDNYNAVKGIFAPANAFYTATDYPPITSSTFETEDGGTRRFLDYDLPYTTNNAMAQRLAKIALYRNRQQIVLSGTFNMSAFKLEVGDTVYITNSRFGFTNKVFEVAEWAMNVSGDETGNPALAVSMTLRETNSAVYDWNAEEVAFDLDDSDLPDPFDIDAPDVATSESVEIVNQQPVASIKITATDPTASEQVIEFEAQYKRETDTDYLTLGSSALGLFQIDNVLSDVTYDIQVRSLSPFGVSEYTTVQHTVTGKADNPSDVTNFSVNIVGQQAELRWTPVTDADLSHYVIRHSPLTTGATYNNARSIVKKVSRPANTTTVPAMTGTYFIKAVDKFLNQSTNASSSVALVDDIGGFNFVDEVVEQTAFAGTKTDVVVVDDKLQLDTSILFDSATGNFDDATGLFDGGGGFVASSGTYDFANYIDLTVTYTGTVNANVKTTQLSQHGGTPTSGATDVDLFVSTTTDDPAGTPTWTAYRPFIVGSYTARALRFRAELSTTESDETPAIEELEASVQLPTRTESDNDIQSGTGAKSVTFARPFKTLLAVSISVGDMQSGDYYAITSKSATGFTINFYDSSDTGVDRLFDYVATGF